MISCSVLLTHQLAVLYAYKKQWLKVPSELKPLTWLQVGLHMDSVIWWLYERYECIQNVHCNSGHFCLPLPLFRLTVLFLSDYLMTGTICAEYLDQAIDSAPNHRNFNNVGLATRSWYVGTSKRDFIFCPNWLHNVPSAPQKKYHQWLF